MRGGARPGPGLCALPRAQPGHHRGGHEGELHPSPDAVLLSPRAQVSMSGVAVTCLLLSVAPPQQLAPADTPPGHVVLMGARLSTTMARLGEPFELSIVARIPPGHILYFPDTLDPRNGIESVGAARWVAEPIAGDSVEMTIVYALRSFAGGALALPEPQLVLHRPAGGAGQIGADGGRFGGDADRLRAAFLRGRVARTPGAAACAPSPGRRRRARTGPRRRWRARGAVGGRVRAGAGSGRPPPDL